MEVYMDFTESIATHSQWKVKLRMFIDGVGQDLDAEHICKDDQCSLGKWIYGTGARYAHDPLYNDLKNSHAAFHKCAAEIVTATKGGDIANAKQLLDHEYSTISIKVVSIIQKMRRIYEEEQRVAL